MYEYRFVRRRYGRSQFYCWAHVRVGDQWREIPDPWPAVNWPKKELQRATELFLTELSEEAKTAAV